jgi:hypothetical protein
LDKTFAVNRFSDSIHGSKQASAFDSCVRAHVHASGFGVWGLKFNYSYFGVVPLLILARRLEWKTEKNSDG